MSKKSRFRANKEEIENTDRPTGVTEDAEFAPSREIIADPDGPDLKRGKYMIVRSDTVDVYNREDQCAHKRGGLINAIATLAVGTMYAAAELSTGFAIVGLLIGAVGLFAKYKDPIMSFLKGESCSDQENKRAFSVRPAMVPA